MTTVHAYAAKAQAAPLEHFEYDLPELGMHEVDIKVTHCGVCHTDLSMLKNDFGMTTFPFVPGHEAAGTVEAVGDAVSHLKKGDRVGLGWHAASCMHCRQCMTGNHNLCPEGVGTIVGRHGGFADRVRCHHAFAVPIPEGVALESAGPLFCGGITVFDPIRLYAKPTDRVGVIGIGGLGHMALKFASAWGCHVTAFTSTDAKAQEAREMGAHQIINSRDEKALEGAAGSLDLILSTVNVPLDWEAYINTLGPDGRLHILGAVLEPIPVPVFPLLMGRRAVSGSPVGAPASIATMLDFAARHRIEPVIEKFPMSEVNEALEHLHQNKARYRIVLEV